MTHVAEYLSLVKPSRRAQIAARAFGYLDEHINRRAALLTRIETCAEDGKVALVESGRDCDGVRYTGRVRLIEATPRAYWAEYEQVADWADGPFSFAIVRPSEATGIEYQSRDLTLEAFEDGHAHCLHDTTL